MAYGYSRSLSVVLGPQDTGTPTSTPNIDSAFVFETSGDAFCVRFVAPVSQSAATLTFYAFVTAVTGTPDFQVEVREGYDGTGDIDRPKTAGSNIGSSSSTVSAPSANTWVSWTITCSLTLGDVYWVLVKNTHATPVSNHATFQYRGALDGFSVLVSPQGYALTAGYTADGFATDPLGVSGSLTGTVVLKFGDGSLLGFPFVTTVAHASDANKRGNQVQFTEDVVLSGIVTPAAVSLITGFSIYQNSSLVLSEAGDASTRTRGVYRFAPTTLTGGVAYDIVLTLSGSSTVSPFYTMGQAEGSVPADVKACMPSWIVGSVDGSGTTFTPDTSQVQLMALIIDDNPAAAGGGGGPVGKNMRGGFSN